MNHLKFNHICCLFVTCILIAGCGRSEPKQHTFLNGQFQLTCPGHWGVRTDLNEEADFQVGNPFSEAYMIVLSEPISDFPEGFALEDFVALITENIGDSLVGSLAGAPKDSSIGGFKCQHVLVSGKADDVDVKFWFHGVQTDDHFHQILQWSLANRFEKNRKDFEMSAGSFKTAAK